MGSVLSPFVTKCRTKGCKHKVVSKRRQYCYRCNLKRLSKSRGNFHPQGMYVVA